MDHPHNFVVVGNNTKNPAKFSTQFQPIKLNQNVGMAINSIFHGSIHNITSENQHVEYETVILKLPNEPRLDDGSIARITERVSESFKLDVGNYSSTLSILKVIAGWFESQFPDYDDRRGGRTRGGGRPRADLRERDGDELWEDTDDYADRSARRIKPDNPLRLEIDESSLDDWSEGFIKITPKHMSLLVNKTSPWDLIGLGSYNIIPQNKTIAIRNVVFSNTIEPAFLYSNIVENSYINGKLSRNLATIPLSLQSGWNFYEFKYPVYIPIDVKEFSKIKLELRDMNGKLIQFDPSFKTILNLHIKPINRATNREQTHQ